MRMNELTSAVIDTCIEIHKNLGPGLLESVYEKILHLELVNQGFYVEAQKPYPVYWKGEKVDLGFRADLVIEKRLILELKSNTGLAPVHYKQLLTYLKIADIKIGLLINFNEALLKNGLKRVVNNYTEET